MVIPYPFSFFAPASSGRMPYQQGKEVREKPSVSEGQETWACLQIDQTQTTPAKYQDGPGAAPGREMEDTRETVLGKPLLPNPRSSPGLIVGRRGPGLGTPPTSSSQSPTAQRKSGPGARGCDSSSPEPSSELLHGGDWRDVATDSQDGTRLSGSSRC